ncbi:DUF6471 domain-containing protein [Paraburkholderia bengalensis]|uniref:DUF6471 domain-containing protein n=1 Tax=Paraburkholderia bengalensis TaxID=2747562 RepID=UPI003AF98608
MRKNRAFSSHLSYMSSSARSQDSAEVIGHETVVDFSREAKLALRAELERRQLTYKDLAARMCEVGFRETPKSVAEKIGKGRFQFAFFLQCFYALGVDVVRIHIPSRPDIAVELARLHGVQE